MSFARVRALRSASTVLRPTGRFVPRVSARTQLVAGRRYASGGGHGHDAPSSDLPWLLGAIAVTIPSSYFLWPSPHEDHGHHDEHHDEGHEDGEEGGESADSNDEGGEDQGGDEKEGDKDESSNDDKSKGEDESKDKSKDGSKDDSKDESEEGEDDAKPSGAEGDSQPKASDANKKSDSTEGAQPKETPESKGNTDGAQFKGKMKEESKGDSRKVEPDSKGAYKKRIDSGLGKNLGAAGGESDDDAPKDPTGMMAKQKGMSNTATRHSTEIHKDPTKSKKPEGPETAKAMGTIDVNRKGV